jgi:hypothetical protein
MYSHLGADTQAICIVTHLFAPVLFGWALPFLRDNPMNLVDMSQK